MHYVMFLDETGDHGLSFVDANFPLFLLCGCVIRKEELSDIEDEVLRLKNKHFAATEVILHSRDIRKCEGAFQILFDLKLKERFYDDLNAILRPPRYRLIASAVHKERHIKTYGKGARDPYTISLSFLVERLMFYLDGLGAGNTAEIVAERRGRKEDQQLLSHFNATRDRGTYYISSDRLRKQITGFTFHAKYDNIVGLQVADLCAYPLARHILHPREPYIPFEVIERNIYCDKRGRYQGWGLKEFP